jgi:hypothetical protein
MLFEVEGIVAIVVLVLWIWALVDCITTDSEMCRNLPKGVWLIIVLLLFDLGAILWVLLGRPANKHWRPGTGPTDYSAPRRPLGAEDRTGFSGDVSDRRSAELDRRLEAWEAQQPAAIASPASEPPGATDSVELDAWEADLARREEELRRRELALRQRDLETREGEIGDA